MDFVNCNPYGAIQSLHVVLCVVYHLMKSFYFFFISFSCLHDIPHFKQLISQMDQNSVLSSKSSWAETFGLCGGWGGRDTQPQCGLECESSPQTSAGAVVEVSASSAIGDVTTHARTLPLVPNLSI